MPGRRKSTQKSGDTGWADPHGKCEFPKELLLGIDFLKRWIFWGKKYAKINLTENSFVL
jgi:hypothetical protein